MTKAKDIVMDGERMETISGKNKTQLHPQSLHEDEKALKDTYPIPLYLQASRRYQYFS